MDTMVEPEPREFAPTQTSAMGLQRHLDVTRLMEVGLGLAGLPVLALIAVRSRETERRSPASPLLVGVAVGALSVGALALGRRAIAGMKAARLRPDRPAGEGSPADGGERRA